MKRLLLTLAILFSGLFSIGAFAVQPNEMLKDPAQEARAREVSKELRCVVCQNESIDESNAEIAHDMRLLVRERIVAGDSNEQIVDYMHSRYGDYVLLKPRLAAGTLVLWLGPFVVLILGAFVVVTRLKRGGDAAVPLSAEEQAALARLTESGDKTS